ncbi:glycosyltransferase [Parapedobacter sp. ISTM3]|uniref:glycosyltransferase family 2 protein n=1 Tax=Parapedobacter sp. ISTM3 TaxID=2800130 RepID=UPI001905FD9D|nr:glycosyltransferase family 2 protein [Parapedobacter sp. ISTM3]MBK1438645.1 glycosyltransferase [Parapedobacter sp. ISTM3]
MTKRNLIANIRKTDGKRDRPVISIIIATYNAEHCLSDCLVSIANQSFREMEVVVIDGGSTDRTVDLLKAAEIDKLRWISEPDKGIYDALNKGVRVANGRWLHFLGADDRLLPGFSELAFKLTDEDTVYYGNSEPADRLPQGAFSNYRLAKYCMNHQSILYPARVFKKYRYDLKYKVFADYALNICVWGDSDFIKKHFPITVVKYQMDGFSSTTIDIQFLKDRERLIRRYFGLVVYLRYLYKKYKTRNISGGIDPGVTGR